MGLDSRKAPPLPAPTETDVGTDLATDLSRGTEHTSQTLPEDGSPVTIPGRKKKHDRDSERLTHASHQSQTSLLIEYFEGGKGSQAESRRPSVRVKVTPSSKSRSRSANEHIQITETKGTRKPSYTKRIELSSKDKAIELEGDNRSLSSFNSATEESNVSRNNPIEIEVMPKRHGSPLIPTEVGSSREARIQPLGSDVSSMPADSFLDGKTRSPERKRSRSLTRGEALAAGAVTGLAAGAIVDSLRTPSRRRSRSLSRERIVAQKVAEKVKSDKAERRKKHSNGSRSRSVSNSEKHTEIIKSPRRRSSRGHGEESLVSGADMSQVTGSRLSADQRSFRSGTSKSSINNPKLLETVEDAIRRLILPELTALKKEQKANANRDKFERERRGSVTSGSTGISRDSRDELSSNRRVSNRSSAPNVSTKPRVTIDGREVMTGDSGKLRKERHDSPRSFERDISEETSLQDDNLLRNKKSNEKRSGLGALAAGMGIGALAATALNNNSREYLDERQERRRRRVKSRSQSDSLAESYEEGEHQVHPPMPMMSDINASEVTRSSILSADTERPDSASGERLMTPVREVQRGYVSPALTPTRSPLTPRQSTPTGRFNRSYADERREPLRNRDIEQQQEEYDLDEDGRKIPMHEPPGSMRDIDYQKEELLGNHSHVLEAGALGAGVGALMGAALRHKRQDPDHLQEEEDESEYYQPSEVPPPLRYVPYNAQKRGLSPIQSVSGYTEDEGAIYHQPRNSGLTRSTESYSTMDQSPQHQKSLKSAESDQSALRENRHDFFGVRDGGLADSELTQDGKYWEEQHKENDRNRDLDSESLRGYKRRTDYTDESFDAPYDGRVSAGQSVRGIGANPDYVHTPTAVESAVASLVSASVLTAGSGHSELDRRGSYASYDDGSERNFTSRGNSPRKYDEQSRDLGYPGSDRQLVSDDNSPLKDESETQDHHFASSVREVASQLNSPSKSPQYAEYELDEQGRKVAHPSRHTNLDTAAAAIAGVAVGAAAATLAKQHHGEAESPHQQYEENQEKSGAPLQKSFKDRAMALEPRSPRHSIDKLITEEDSPEMTANFIPDAHDPMPAIGYGDQISEPDSNHSYVQSPLGGREYGNRDHWPNLETPQQPKMDTATAVSIHDRHSPIEEAENGLGLVGVTDAAVTAATLANHVREASQDQDEQYDRTSDERKRDTLITNPYEGTSPVTLLGGLQDRNLLGRMGYDGIDHGYSTGSPGVLPKDEGYISAANARSPGAATPEQRRKGVGFTDDVDMGAAAGAFADEDPFYTPKHSRHLSGMSHGMESPLYDSATGIGLDRIQSKDIVALMDHLTVRDAQRSARDTEILVTLVRAAAEMRNSFEDMKRLLADTEDVIITETQRNTDRSVQKVINGPRPPPPSISRSRGSQDGTVDDLPNKKRNVFRRALKGLSMRSSNDLNKIEDMLVQLLSEVEGLKVAQGLPGRSNPSDTFDNIQQEDSYEQDRGYEPEGNAGTSTASHASQSGHFSNPLSRGASASRGYDGRKFSENRISTVPEGDEEELDIHEQAVLANQFEHNEELLTPTREPIRGASAPLDSPPQQYVATASLSNENTPKTDKSKKHKSSSSSGWIPRISRWSETTASTVARGFRGSSRRDTETNFDQQPQSRSGSDLGNYENSPQTPYGEDKLHSGFSQDNMHQSEFDENRPQLTSLLPPEDPKYKAHRNSLNLQHPQPRPGPTHRYQTALESQAQEFDSPMSPKSIDFGSSTSVNRLPQNRNVNRYSNDTNGSEHLSPVSNGGFENPPARPPKELLSSSTGPERPSKVRNKLTKRSPLSNEHLNVDEIEDDKRVSYGTVSTAANQAYDSPRSSGRVLSANLGVPTRKPTGPRNMGERSRSGNLSPTEISNGEGETTKQKKRDTFGTIASNHSVESETF